MEPKQIIINESLISYATAGRGDHSLIFLHGWRSNKEAWLPVTQLMENAGYRLIFIDLPGFGSSETPKQPYTLHDYAQTVRLFAEKLDLKVHAVIGHSAGARIAAKLAAEHPEFMDKLVLIASGGARPAFIKLKACLAKIAKPFFIPRFMTPLRKKLYAWIGAEDYLATPDLQKTFVNVIKENLDQLLPQIKNDTLIIWGEKDETAPLEYGKHMTRLIPNAHLEIIENAGHYCFREQPQLFSGLIVRFIAL